LLLAIYRLPTSKVSIRAYGTIATKKRGIDYMAEKIIGFARSNGSRWSSPMLLKFFYLFYFSYMYVFRNQYMESSFSIVIKVLNIYCWYKKLYNVFLCMHACKMCTPHLPCYISEKRKNLYVYTCVCVCVCMYVCIYMYTYMKDVNLLLIKYLNSQIRSSYFLLSM